MLLRIKIPSLQRIEGDKKTGTQEQAKPIRLRSSLYKVEADWEPESLAAWLPGCLATIFLLLTIGMGLQ